MPEAGTRQKKSIRYNIERTIMTLQFLSEVVEIFSFFQSKCQVIIKNDRDRSIIPPKYRDDKYNVSEVPGVVKILLSIWEV